MQTIAVNIVPLSWLECIHKEYAVLSIRYSTKISYICSGNAVVGTVYVVHAEPFMFGQSW